MSETSVDLSSYAGAGTENITKDDLQVPFLQLIQTNSAEVDRGHPDYATKAIEGVSAGDIINTVTRKIVASEGDVLKVIPVSYEKAYVEWRPRSQGGGIVQVHDSAILSECKKNEFNKDTLSNGNEIVATAYHIIMYEANDQWEKAIIAMQATQLKKSRAWLSKITSLKIAKEDGTKFNAPMFSHSYQVSSVIESNNLGSWQGWKIEFGSRVEDSEALNHAIGLLETSKTLKLTEKKEDDEPY